MNRFFLPVPFFLTQFILCSLGMVSGFGAITASDSTADSVKNSDVIINLSFDPADYNPGDTVAGFDSFSVTWAKGKTTGNKVPHWDEFQISLTSPSGKIVQIVNSTNAFAVGNQTDVFTGTTLFSDSASTSPTGLVPTNNFTYLPAEAFSTFVGDPVAGTWALTFKGLANSDTPITYSGSSITLSVSGIPEPSAVGRWGAAGVVILAIFGWRRRRPRSSLSPAAG